MVGYEVFVLFLWIMWNIVMTFVSVRGKFCKRPDESTYLTFFELEFYI